MLQGHVEGSRLLLEAGARALGPDHEGFTPLHRCCQEDPMAKEAEAGAEDAAEARAKFDRAKAAVARLLLERGADVNVREAKGHQVSCDWRRPGHVTPCSPLIGRQSPLHLAAMNGLAAVTETLLQNRADTGAANKVKHL